MIHNVVKNTKHSDNVDLQMVNHLDWTAKTYLLYLLGSFVTERQAQHQCNTEMPHCPLQIITSQQSSKNKILSYEIELWWNQLLMMWEMNVISSSVWVFRSDLFDMRLVIGNYLLISPNKAYLDKRMNNDYM